MTPDTTIPLSSNDEELKKKLQRLLEDLVVHTANEYGGFEGFDDDDSRDGINQALSPLLNLISEDHKAREAEIRIDELANFNPLFKGDHSECPDTQTCIGYQNAESDFDNEKAIRIAELQPQGDRTHEST